MSEVSCPSCGEVLPKCNCPSGVIAKRAYEEIATMGARLAKAKAKTARWREEAEKLARALDGYCSRTCGQFHDAHACACGGQTAHEALTEYEENKE